MPDDTRSEATSIDSTGKPVDDFMLGAFPDNPPKSLKEVLERRLEGLRPDALRLLPLPARQRAMVDQLPASPLGKYTPADANSRRKLVERTSYFIGDALVDAVQVALLLRQPLLLTGEPGVGKTAFAEALAARLGLGVEIVSVKSTTTGRDLLYEFDEVGRFRNANEHKKRGLTDFLTLRGLGLAVARGLGPDHAVTVGRSRADVFGGDPAGDAQADDGPLTVTLGELFPKAFPEWRVRDKDGDAANPRPADAAGTTTVVLLDEFDKAVRDTPNDLLLELERLSIEIRELDTALDLGQKPWNWPIVLVTTNDERSLPAPFLRRCVHHHMTLPDDALIKILLSKLSKADHDVAGPGRAGNLARALNAIKKSIDGNMGLSRRPGTAEYIGAYYLLIDQGADVVDGEARFTLPGDEARLPSLREQVSAVLAKTLDDRTTLSEILASWVASKKA